MTPLTSIFDIHSHIRRNIWIHLDYKDHLSLRRVCSDFQKDIDFDVGLTWTITKDLSNLSFFRFDEPQIRIRKCIVNQTDKLTEEILRDFNFLEEPSFLEFLTINPVTPIHPHDISWMTKNCDNLAELTIYTLNSKEMLLFDDNEARSLLSLVTSKPRLRKLALIIYSHPKSSLRDTRKTYPITNYSLFSTGKIPTELTSVYLEIPWVDSSILGSWKSFLESQTRLKVLVCNLGLMYWDFYTQTIQKNSTTLEKVILRRVTGVNPNVPRHRVLEHSFDWSIFSECSRLRYIKIVHDDVMLQIDEEEIDGVPLIFMLWGRLASENLDLFPTEHIELFHVRNMHIHNDELERFRAKSRRTLRTFHNRTNFYVDEEDDEFLLMNSGNVWFDVSLATEEWRGDLLRRLNFPVFRDEIGDTNLLATIYCALCIWLILVFCVIVGPFAIGCIMLAVFIM